VLRDNPMDGAKSGISLEREPEAFLAAAIEGHERITPCGHAIPARAARGRPWAAGYGLERIVNGRPRPLSADLSQIRIRPPLPRPRAALLAAGYRLLRDSPRSGDEGAVSTDPIMPTMRCPRLVGAGVPGAFPDTRAGAVRHLIMPIPAPPPGRPRRADRTCQTGTSHDRDPRLPRPQPAIGDTRQRRSSARTIPLPERPVAVCAGELNLAIQDGRVAGASQSGIRPPSNRWLIVATLRASPQMAATDSNRMDR